MYGGNLTALLLPDKVIVSVPARKTYVDYIKSKNHKIYAMSLESARQEMRDSIAVPDDEDIDDGDGSDPESSDSRDQDTELEDNDSINNSGIMSAASEIPE